MHLLGIVGPGASELADRVADRFDGRVATIESLGDGRRPGAAGPGTPAAASSYGLADGSWIGAGEGRSVDDLLDDLAPDHDYAVLVGFPTVDAPTVVVGETDVDPAGETVASAAAPDEVDLDAVADRVADARPHVTLEALVERAKASPDAAYAGAIATFTGRVRAKESPDDDRTTYLEFEAYDEVAAERTAALRAELCEREGVYEVLLHHRTGRVADGDDIVFVVVLAGHRGEAFATVSDAIDRLKAEVPIFKKETTETSEFWVHDPDEA